MYVYVISGTVAIDSALTIRDRQKNCPKIPGGKGNHFFDSNQWSSGFIYSGICHESPSLYSNGVM